MLLGVAAAVFGIAAFALVQIMPSPLATRDYFIVGCLSTLVALGALFAILISTSLKSANPFFKRRKR
jgi:hypothetical protein